MKATNFHVETEPILCALLDSRSNELPNRTSSLEFVTKGLQAWLKDRGETEFETRNIRRLAGGGTNALFAFVLHRPTGEERLILRIKTPGSGVVSHVIREFEMQQAAAAIIPVPEPIAVTVDLRYFSAPAMICRFSEGVQKAADEIAASGVGLKFDSHLRQRLGPQFASLVGKLHGMTVPTEKLAHFAIPREGTTDAIDWQLAFWKRLWDEDKLEDHPVMTLAYEWLMDNRQPVEKVSLLHGDYRNGNFLFDMESREITAILDWEMCALGDHHRDLAYTMLGLFGSNDESGKFLVAGLIPESDFIDLYERESNLRVDRSRLRYYSVFNMYWTTISTLATGLRNGIAGRTQLDVMYNVMTGQATSSLAGLAREVIGEPR